MARPIDVVRKIAPNAKASYLAAIENGDALFRQHGITTPRRLAHFLAQILHESGGLKIEWENMNYSAQRLVEVFGPGRHSAAVGPAEAARLAHNPPAIAERVYGRGNPRFADKLGNVNQGDGFKYRGGGLMQTTGRSNYRRMGQKCGVDFEGTPELVLSAEHALKPALIEWSEGRLNAFADNDDILAISRFINLGNAHSPRMPNGMQSRMTWFAKVRQEIGDVELRPGDVETVPAATPPERPQPQPAPAIALSVMLAGRMLQQGDQGDDVRAVQLALAKLGYPLRGTGYFGGATDAAVTGFQERHDLEIDGVVGPETAKALDAALAALGGGAGAPAPQPDRPQPPAQPEPSPAIALSALLVGKMLKQRDQGDDVRAVQLALAKLGYPLRGTGFYGGNTEAAVTDFQKRHGLEVDGVVGPETARAIDVALAGGRREGPAQPRPAGAGDPSPGVVAGDRPLWLIEGLKWLGTREVRGPGSNPDILDWARAEGGDISKSYRDDSIPWCALFANMVLTKIGIKGTETLWALDWSRWGRKLDGPAVGAFAPMKRQGGGHIAIVVGRDQHGNLMCLGGNQNDQVSIAAFPANRPLSFRWPSEFEPPARVGMDTLPLVRSDGRLSSKET